MTRLARYAWATLAYNLAVILWGAIVRATGSGAGCGSHWPLCNGEVVPRAPALATLIEFSHRATSGLALLMVIGLFVAARRSLAKGHAGRFWAGASLLLILSEAGVGAGLVLFELVAHDQSLARALFMGTHLVNTFFLLAALALVAHHASQPGPRPLERAPLPRPAFFAALFGMLLVGSSGAIAALGDTLFPPGSLSEAFAQDVSPTAHALVRLRMWHPVLAVGVGIGLLALAAQAGRPGPARRYARMLGGLVMLQTLVGAINVALLAPIIGQLAHLLLADLLWIALVLLGETSRAQPAFAGDGRQLKSAMRPASEAGR